MEKEEQSGGTTEQAIQHTRKTYDDMGREATKRADWTKEDTAFPKDEQTIVTVESGEEVVINRELYEEGEKPAFDTETTPKDDDTYVCNEENIEQNFKTFRPYIETCVKVTDLIVFYNLFTAEQTKKFLQVFKTDPTGATSMAFDEIVTMENQPEKYRCLLSALKAAGYPKVEEILKGLLQPVANDHRQTIRRSSKDIYQSLVTKEVLPHLLSRDVISIDDYEEIRATERNFSSGSAALELLHVLPSRQKHWYRHFIESLIESNHEDLAQSIDKDLVKKLKTLGASGLPAAYKQVSCRPPYSGSRRRNEEFNDDEEDVRSLVRSMSFPTSPRNFVLNRISAKDNAPVPCTEPKYELKSCQRSQAVQVGCASVQASTNEQIPIDMETKEQKEKFEPDFKRAQYEVLQLQKQKLGLQIKYYELANLELSKQLPDNYPPSVCHCNETDQDRR